MIENITQIVMTLLTAALTYYTYVLAKHTKVLNDRDDALKRENDIKKCIYLAEKIVRNDYKELGNWSIDGLSSHSVQPFNELLVQSKYIHDSDTRKLLENVASVLTNGLLNQETSSFTNPQFVDSLRKLRERLTQEILEFQKDLGNYS